MLDTLARYNEWAGLSPERLIPLPSVAVIGEPFGVEATLADQGPTGLRAFIDAYRERFAADVAAAQNLARQPAAILPLRHAGLR